jgi:hypothetical protein
MIPWDSPKSLALIRSPVLSFSPPPSGDCGLADPLRLPQRLELEIEPELYERIEEMSIRSGRSIPEIIQGLISNAFPMDPAEALRQARSSPVVVLNRNNPDAVLIGLEEGGLLQAPGVRLALVSGPQTLLLIDERAGQAVAEAFGIQLAGTAAVIGMARQRHLIDSARAVFAELHANNVRIAPAVIQAVLQRCGE